MISLLEKGSSFHVFGPQISNMQIHDAFNPFCWVCNEPKRDSGSAQCSNKSRIITENHPLSNFYHAEFNWKGSGFSLQSMPMNVTRHKNIKSKLKPELTRNHPQHLTLKVQEILNLNLRIRKQLKEEVMRSILEVTTSQLSRVLASGPPTLRFSQI